MAKKVTKPVRPKKLKPYDPSGEPLTVNDHLSIARSMLWVAGNCLKHADDADLRAAGSMVNDAVRSLDRLFSAVPPSAPVRVVGAYGLPPNPAFVKLARLILESHRDSGGRSVQVGSSAFTCRLEPRIVDNTNSALPPPAPPR